MKKNIYLNILLAILIIFFLSNTYLLAVTDTDSDLIVLSTETYILDNPHTYTNSVQIYGKLYLNTKLTTSNLTISSGGVVTHTLQDSDFDLEVSNNLIIEDGGSINVDYKGYVGGSGPAWPHGSIYEPVDMGAGGGANAQCAGATGGGKIKITAKDMVVNGQISARGQNGISYHYWSPQYTNGAEGGSIYIRTQALSGSGKILADGGDSPYYSVSGGAGGRIAIYYKTNNLTGNITANGGRGSGGLPTEASAGTIYTKSAQQSNGYLTLDNNTTNNSWYTLLPQGTYTLDNIIIKNKAELRTNNTNEITTTNLIITNYGTLTNNGNLTITNLTLESGGVLYHNEGNLSVKGTIPNNGILQIGSGGTFYLNTALSIDNLTISSGGVVTHTLQDSDFDLEVSNNLIIEDGGSINADYKGYPGGNGPSWPHGSIYEPVDMGAGGGANAQCAGATGGGKIKITAKDMVVNGQISTRGQNGISYHYWSEQYTTGAEGGSIYIRTQALFGNGKIISDGGNTPYYSVSAGPGGRIAIYYEINNFTGNITGNGGRGTGGLSKDSAAGTIYIKSTQQSNGNLTLDNNSSNNCSPTLLPQGTYTLDNIIMKNKAELRINNTNKITTTDLTITNNGILSNNGDLTITNLTLENGGMLYYNEGSLLILGTPQIGNKGTFYLNTKLTTSNLTISSGGVVTHTLQDSDFDLEVSNNLIIEDGGSINVDYKGYPGGSGPAGIYGSIYEPAELGSGGNANEQCAGASGGGKIKIIANNIIINGQITARGQKGIKYNYWGDRHTSGGRGGSIYIITKTLSGNGEINADGGDASEYYLANAGAGGRIAVYYETTSYTGSIQAKGGQGLANAPDGTVIYKSLTTDSPVAVSDLTETYTKNNIINETLKK